MQILLVEDNPAMASSLSGVFERLGYEVAVRASRTGALAYYRRDPQAVDLLVLDVGLPDGSGLDLLRDLRVAGCRARAFVITASEHTREANISAFQLGAVFVPAVALDEVWRAHLLSAEAARAADERPLLTAVELVKGEHDLSDQAATILFLKTRGHTIEEIARAVELSPDGVRHHIRRILRRSGHRKIRDLVKAIHDRADQRRATDHR